MDRSYYKLLYVSLTLCFITNLAMAENGGQLAPAASAAPSAVPSVVAEVPTVTSDAPAASAAPVSAAVSDAAPASTPVADKAASPSSDALTTGLAAIQATKAAVEGRNLPAWLSAFAAILWCIIAVMRKLGHLQSRRAVAVTTLVAAVLGGVGSQMLLGVSATEAFVIALGGPGAIALQEVSRAFGINLSPAKPKA